MQSDPSENYLKWFIKAGEDQLSIRAILKEGSPSTGCFLSQQMAEKYLKGMLVFYEIEFLKVHDLLDLETLLLNRQPEIGEIHSDLQTLNRYYIETRYPGDVPEFTMDECKSAFDAALRVKEFVLKKVSAKTL